ncbi:unnamed protein product, partial [Phaeothamnion confervicola]
AVAENAVKITFVNIEGNRLTVPALVGRTLVDVAREHDVELDAPCHGGGGPEQIRQTPRWTEDVFGSGPSCAYCHVMIPKEYHSVLPEPFPREMELLAEGLGDDFAPDSSRLGCQITVTAAMDGMTVFLPDGPPSDCP